MSNNARYHNAWESLYRATKKAREEYEADLVNLEKYKGSEGYGDDVTKARQHFEDALTSARAAATGEFNIALAGMERNTAPKDTLDAPTDAQIRVLQALNMRENIPPDELEAAAKTLADSETALRTLEEIAAKKGFGGAQYGDMRFKLKSTADQAREAVKELRKAATTLQKWDGRTHSEIVKEIMQARHNSKWGGEYTPRDKQLGFDVAFAADMEAGLTPQETLSKIVGGGISPAALRMLD